jgi:hypothetical protein
MRVSVFVLRLALLVFALPVYGNAQTLVGWSTVETEHFRFQFPPQTHASPSTFSQQLEQAYTELRSTFPGTPPGKINFYVWNSSEDAEGLLGRPLGFANPKRMLIHATADQTRGHELTHVLVHYTAAPEVTTRFISEGTAVAFDLTGRDRLGIARTTLAQAQVRPGGIARIWTTGESAPDALLYPVAGAFVQRLVERGGRDRFLRLLKRQTFEHAREVYGADLDRIIADFDSDLGAQAGGTPPGQADSGPPLEELRARAQARMRQDREAYAPQEVQAIEALYQSANSNLSAPESRDRLQELVLKYPKANRTGCAVLYLAQASRGDERERLLKKAIENHSDAWYGDGTQVGAFARALLAQHYANTDRRDQATALAAEVEKLFPGAVDHAGARLADTMKRLKLLQ